jgi:SAM-dependent methyltransferase
MRVDYDSIASTYHQRYADGPLRGVAACLHRLASRLGPARVLEVGCGTGQWLAELNSEGRLYGLDFSAGMLRQARRIAPGAGLARGEASQLPFPPSAFDLVYCVNAFHHFESKPAFIGQARRILRPGGVLAVTGMDPHLVDDWYLYHYFEGTLDTDLRRFPSGGQMLDWMAAAGFERVEWETAQVIRRTFTGRDVFADPFLQKHSTSQLVLLDETAYAAGLRRLEADVARAEAAGEILSFPVNIRLTMIAGHAGPHERDPRP